MLMNTKYADKNVAEKIDELAKDTVKSIESGSNPDVTFPLRGLSNVYFDEIQKMVKLGDKTQTRNFFNVGQAKKFMQTFLVARVIKELVKGNITAPIRSIYYNTKHTIGDTSEETWEDQSESDPIIEDLEITLGSLREELHVRAGQKGSMVGNLTIIDAGDTIDLRKMGSGGWSIPSIVEKDIIKFTECEADYILFIEKDTIWSRFNEDKFWKKNNCIIMHGGGQPPRGVRRLVRRMHDESKRMAIPEARFIGLSSFDQEKYKLPKNVTLKLKDIDRKRISEVLAYPWFKKKQWQDELKHMVEKGVKLELEALSAKDFKFITEKYVPEKIKQKDWLV